MPERKIARRLLLAGAAAAVFGMVATDAFLTSSVLRRIAATTTLDASQQAAPRAPEARERSAMLLPGALDAKWYLIHAEQFLTGDSWRIRRTELDNTPQGREVHWASLIPWSLGLAALVAAGASSGSPTDSVQGTALWFGPVSQMFVFALLTWLICRRFGAAIAALALLLLATSASFAGTFQSGQVDHHGIASALCLASVFCLGAGSAGLGSQRWPAASGVCAGLAMWISSATAVPVIAASGVAWLLAILVVRPAPGLRLRTGDPWRWAVAGAATSLVLYALEYFPDHMGWRLEVNHPLYAAAWLGAGWLLSQTLRRLAAWKGLEADGGPRGSVVAAIAATLAVAAPAVLIAVARDRVFLVSDPFLFDLHERYIREFTSLGRTLVEPGWEAKLIDLAWWPALFVIVAALLLRRRQALPECVPAVLVVALVPALVGQAEAILQVRWTGLATALWIGALVLATGLAAEFQRQLAWRRWTKILLGAWVALGLLPAAIATARGVSTLAKADLPEFPKAMVPSLLLRDIAHRMARTDPARVPRVLADPTSSSELAFYGGIPVIGTLYWENTEGLKRAARIFSATSAEEALSLLQEAGITHIVLPTWDTFSELDAYSQLLAADDESSPPTQPYLARVLSGQEQPEWIRPIHYPIPQVFGVGNCRVDIVEVMPGQTPFAARRARGLFEFERGDYAAAIRQFEEALRLQPDAPEIADWVDALRRKLGAPPNPSAPGS